MASIVTPTSATPITRRSSQTQSQQITNKKDLPAKNLISDDQNKEKTMKQKQQSQKGEKR